MREVAATGTKSDIEQLQTQFGYILSPDGMVACPNLNIDLISIWAWDWMRCYFIDGVFVNEFTELLKRLEKHALGGAAFAKYLASWKWPKGYASGRNVCSAAEGSMDYSPGGSASEMLSVVPVLEKLILDVAMPKMVCASELQSALLLIKVVGFIN